MTSALVLCRLWVSTLQQSFMLTDMPVITWHAFRIYSRFLEAGTSFNARRDLLSVTYRTTCEKMNSSKRQSSSFVSCLMVSVLETRRTLPTDLLISQNCRNVHWKAPSTRTSLKLQMPRCSPVRESCTGGDVRWSPSPSSYTETWAPILKPLTPQRCLPSPF